jgi:hypothetical protein
MKKNHYYWAAPLTGVVLVNMTASAEPEQNIYLDSTNRVTLSLRFGFNITGKFEGVGSSFTSGSIYGNTQRTPNGDPYNYDNGYVLKDSTGNALGYSSYWGYNNASQVNSADHSISFNQTTASGIPSEVSDNENGCPGAELTYDRQLGVKEDWHNLRYGVEGALNYTRISFSDNISGPAQLNETTTTYTYQQGDTPPTPLPFQGTYSGSGYMYLQVPPTYPTTTTPVTTTPGATFLSQNSFDGNLFGGRLGPYVELPLTDNIDLRLSAGLAVGLLYGSASWQDTLILPNNGGTLSTSGSGDSLDTLWGGYASLDGTWQINNRWAVDGAVQFQDLGTCDHSYQGREVELDLSHSLFLELGISYSF